MNRSLCTRFPFGPQNIFYGWWIILHDFSQNFLTSRKTPGKLLTILVPSMLIFCQQAAMESVSIQ
jgi:hypothetical protein